MTSETGILTRTFSKTVFPLLVIHIVILQNTASLAVCINSIKNLTLHCIQPQKKMVLATQSIVGINSIGG